MLRFFVISCFFTLCACGSAMSSGMSSMTDDVATVSDAASDAPAPDAANDAPDSTVADVPAAAACTATSTVKSKTTAVAASLCSSSALTNNKTVSIQVLLVDSTSGAPLAGLDLSIDFVHTAMGHSGSKVPSASEIGNGLYQIDNLAPTGMTGDWTLTIKFAKDSAVFHVTVS